jgi:hypothetical protein
MGCSPVFWQTDRHRHSIARGARPPGTELGNTIHQDVWPIRSRVYQDLLHLTLHELRS